MSKVRMFVYSMNRETFEKNIQNIAEFTPERKKDGNWQKFYTDIVQKELDNMLLNNSEKTKITVEFEVVNEEDY